MDKSWMKLSSRWSSEYEAGVKSFIEFAKNSVDSKNRIPCPCRLCNNVYFQKLSTVEDHLVESGIMPDYTCWIHHGEPFVGNYDEVVGNGRVEVSDNDIGDDHDFPLYVNDDMQGMIENIYAGSVLGNNMDTDEGRTSNPITEEESKRFSRLLEDAKREAYPGCKKYSKLSALVKLLHIKTSNNWSNKSVDQLFEFLADFIPPGGTLPTSYREAKTLMRDLGLTYNKIDACKFNCILYRKEYKDLDSCPKCGESRWETNTSSQRKKVPQKVLRHFPLKPRLQRLFMSKKIAKDMRWHKEKHVEEENLCKHPVDSETWKDFDKRFDWFARDPRNIRLGLASDGFNPFGDMSTSYSMWPVVLTPYNLPPWMCMKEPFFFLSLLIPGRESPGNDIDVYLQPLIEELTELWEEGIDTYDAHSGKDFKLHAAVLWTISDFPAYAMLSGWSTKGKLACPSCNVDNDATTLKHGKKQCYDVKTGSLRDRRGRGASRSLSLKKHMKAYGGKLPVLFPEGSLVPVGKYAGVFVSELGIQCRKRKYIHAKAWKDVDDDDKIELLKHLKDKFEIDLNLTVLEGIEQKLMYLHKQWIYRLHMHFKSFASVEEAIQHPHPQVAQDDWEKLCNELFTDEGYKKKSETNASNRSKREITGTLGSRSYLNHRFMKRNNETNEELSDIAFWKESHYNADTNKWSCPRAEELYEEMIQLQVQPAEEGDSPLTEEQIIERVLRSDSGYLLGVGYGDTRRKQSRVRRNSFVENSRVLDAEKRAEEAQKQVEEAQKQAEEAKKQAEEARQQAEAAERNVEQMRVDIDVMNQTMNQFKAVVESISAVMPNREHSNTLSRMGIPTRISAVMPHGEQYNGFPTHD